MRDEKLQDYVGVGRHHRSLLIPHDFHSALQPPVRSSLVFGLVWALCTTLVEKDMFLPYLVEHGLHGAAFMQLYVKARVKCGGIRSTSFSLTLGVDQRDSLSIYPVRFPQKVFMNCSNTSVQSQACRLEIPTS